MCVCVRWFDDSVHKATDAAHGREEGDVASRLSVELSQRASILKLTLAPLLGAVANSLEHIRGSWSSDLILNTCCPTSPYHAI